MANITRRGFGRLAAGAALTTAVALVPGPVFAADEDDDASADPTPMLRLYNPWSGEHLFTADVAEYDSLSEAGWRREGLAWMAPAAGDPVWRLYNPYSGDHLYTGDASEYDSLGTIGWSKEGEAFLSAGEGDTGAVSIYRLYNPWLTAGTHLFTTNYGEYQELCGLGWSGEGIAFRGVAPDGGVVRCRIVNQDGRPIDGVSVAFWSDQYAEATRTPLFASNDDIWTGVVPDEYSYYFLFSPEPTVDGEPVDYDEGVNIPFDLKAELNGEDNGRFDGDGYFFFDVEDGKLTDVTVVIQTKPAA